MHVVDSGVAACLLRLTLEKLARLDPVAQTEFGHLLETFTGVGHWRTSDGEEADLVVAFEISAGSAVLYLGSRSYSYEDRLHALPLDRLWTPL